MTISSLSPRPRGVVLSVEELRAAWEDAIDKHSDYIRIAHVMDTIPNPEIVRQLAETQDAACEAYLKAVQG